MRGGLPPLLVRTGRRLSDEGAAAATPDAAPPARHDAPPHDAAALVANANRVLGFVGLAATAHTLQHALAVCAGTSLFVAAIEAAVGHRLEGTNA